MNHRKTHLYSDYERKYFTAGDEFPPIVEIEGVKVTTLICWEIEFPELTRLVALKGANFIIVPTANTSKFLNEITIRARAFENQIFVAYVNHVGVQGDLNMCGESICVASNGDILAMADDKSFQLSIVDILPNEEKYLICKNKNPYFEDRRPDLYIPLTEKH